MINPFEVILERLESIENKLNTLTPPKDDDIYLNVKQTAEFLDVAVATINKYARDGKITPHQIGGKKLFLKSEIINQIKI